ncbi:hypothetical protein [Reyranella sp.]|jgi:hypothetical protein|uniref:hypothetical protein n=1 Tax=Reyranella sp. TaxID=1929291 RepID=UPI000BD14A95|nr:hypothetical protein [Reyranella sp.]OYY46745.1 MAG: hypothetical protein B7Y57_00425 [Rhodospirillales bacterium 35-66-84]OYZ96765.1 MAG: hypothetical protein B7Y08_00785 [Rhodospirillales bacterium 24-66-33]OZB27908.1 MAG: hypothetical protein B7X63_04355 [Rhodospirillales bacterium 39-66-50]HQS13650.1 hypothetical protein [Reyranella sp.]HQT10135.1 hypothetical protein [Reyranella sp.]
MKRAGIVRLLVLLVAFDLGTVAVAMAQPASPPSSRAEDVFTYYYRDPRPERLVGWFDGFGRKRPDWVAYPPVAGFFAIVFATQPGWIEKLVPAQLNARQADTISAALRLSGQAASRDLQARLAQAGTDRTLTAQFSGLPDRLTNLRIASPTHLDILWGASFASGDGRYARMIADFLARTANRSETIALDVTRIATAASRGDFSSLAQLKEKYEPGLLLEMVYAGTAAWALTSNARQHAFVDGVVTRYIADHSGTPAAKVLSTLKGA